MVACGKDLKIYILACGMSCQVVTEGSSVYFLFEEVIIHKHIHAEAKSFPLFNNILAAADYCSRT